MKRGAAVACALVLVLAGCGTKSSGTDSATQPNGGPPPGGWPQPANGQLTTQMCGLLTDADYARYGHERLSVVSQKRVENEPNAVQCLYTASDELSLNLQPTAEAAKLTYDARLRDHKRRLVEDDHPTVLAQNVVPGSDQSWFDYSTLSPAGSKYIDYEISVRRGSLIVGITLSGLKGKKEQDPRVLLSGLAGLVLQRIPTVGRTDTGRTQKARFSVVGPGRARQIIYNDPSTSKLVTLKNVKLPWHVEKPLVTLGDSIVPFTLNATSSAPNAALGCSISVDGQTVVVHQPTIGAFVSCIESWTPPK